MFECVESCKVFIVRIVRCLNELIGVRCLNELIGVRCLL